MHRTEKLMAGGCECPGAGPHNQLAAVAAVVKVDVEWLPRIVDFHARPVVWTSAGNAPTDRGMVFRALVPGGQFRFSLPSVSVTNEVGEAEPLAGVKVTLAPFTG